MSDDQKKSLRNEEELKLHPQHETDDEKPNVDGDRLNMFVLIVLYMLQNIPVGMLTN